MNFTDDDLFEFATRRADYLYGGNFSAYVLALIDEDRAAGKTRQAGQNVESKIRDTISPFGFLVPKLSLAIMVKSRFPVTRQAEYVLLGSIQKAAIAAPNDNIVLVFPESLPNTEKERFRLFGTSGIPNLRACDTAELKKLLDTLAPSQGDPR